jgi:hypothetical protein
VSPRLPAVPASCARLDFALVESAIVDARGNVTAAARALCVPASDLRRLLSATPALADAGFEQIEQAIDEAQAALLEGLRHENLGRRLQAAGFFLRHSGAAERLGNGARFRGVRSARLIAAGAPMA